MRLTQISFSTIVVSVWLSVWVVVVVLAVSIPASVLITVCVAGVDLAASTFSISFSVLITVCVAIVVLAVSVSGLSVFGLFRSTTVIFDVELPPKMIFGRFDCFGFVISSFASVSAAVEVDGVGDFFNCFHLAGVPLCHLGSGRLSSRSDAFCQSSKLFARPRGLVVFNSGGMNPPAKFLVSFLLIVLKLIALIVDLLQLKIFECERVDCLSRV